MSVYEKTHKCALSSMISKPLTMLIWRLQYAKHIVNPVTLSDDPMNPEQVAGWKHPYLIMECMGNGTLRGF